jgi:CxxC motif-containing protein (DUF1111 family)
MERALRNGLFTLASATFVATGFAVTRTATIEGAGGQVSTQSPAAVRDSALRFRFSHDGLIDQERVLTLDLAAVATEAPTGFENLTNGFDSQGAPYESLNEDNVVPLRSFNDNRFIFEEVETIDDGLGPTYNAQSCRECHQNIVTGGASQITEQRTGHLLNGRFFESQGGSLIQSRGTYPEAVELVAVGDDIRTFRISTNTLGLGFVEAIANDTLTGLRNRQPLGMQGLLVLVPVLESSGRARYGRFGWKAQHASLESFAADAYLNEMGVTSPLLPIENSISGGDVVPYDPVADPEDDGTDVLAFANFMRSTMAPSRGPITADVLAGEQIFARLGCSICHVAAITTAAPGTVINGGAMTVPAALGDKIIHPYSDFLLHNIGTGDGIPIQPTLEYAPTANRIRTAPLWGLRTRNRLLHDGLSFTREEAIAQHAGQAAAVTLRYQSLGASDKAKLIAFLNSL